ncbi:DUF4919 domain-containing protein [Glaciecola sp. 1036]|uniref:DUF4919 domain-containing protein n=1 Tax=Alteromonadaceae TaxID=72275 RepID=UPI003CFD22DF
MKTLLYCLLLLTSLWLSGCGATSTESPQEKKKQVLNYEKSNADYRQLVGKLLTQDATAQDFDRLLKLFPLTSYYAPRSDLEQKVKEASKTLMQKKQWIMCIRENRQLLEQNYTSFTAHYGMAICSEEAGDSETARFHNWVLDNFIESTWRSGNGQTPETAFYINSSSDLIAFIQLHQMVGVDQELIYKDQLPVQKVRVQNPENQRYYTWYFDMTPQFRRAYIDKIESQ